MCHALLLKAGSETYLFLKSKSCGSCAARRAGLFSPLSKVSLPLLPDSASFPPSSSPIQIFRVGFIRQVWGSGVGKRRRRGSWNRLAAAPWVGGCVNPVWGMCCQCPAFAHNLLPGRGCPLLHVTQKDNEHGFSPPSVFRSGWKRKGKKAHFGDLFSAFQRVLFSNEASCCLTEITH